MTLASCAGSSMPCSATPISAGTCGSSCSVSSARSFRTRARAFDLRIGAIGVVDVLDANDGERPAVEELEDAKAPQAARDDVVAAVGRGDVAQHGGAGADPVQVVGSGLVDVGLALQQDADRPFEAHRLLHRGLRALAADRRSAARWPGRRRGCAPAGRSARRRAAAACSVLAFAPSGGDRARLGGAAVVEHAPEAGARDGSAGVLMAEQMGSDLRNRSTRQPCATSGRPTSKLPGGRAIRRSNAP